jgi:hypothetical protein
MSTPTVGEKRQIIVTLNGVDVPEYTGDSDNHAVATIVPGGAVNFVQLHAAGDFTLNLTAAGGETGSATFTVVADAGGALVITLSEPV